MFEDPIIFDSYLKNPHTLATHKIHSAVIASGSKYFIEVFMAYPKELRDKPEFAVPVLNLPIPI
jgi:hypothetical protein